jgi:hypothetical protein
MLEGAYGTAEMKKTQVYRWHKCGLVSISDSQHCGQCSGPLIRYEFISERCTVSRENVHQNFPLPEGSSEKESPRRMGMKQLVSFM